MIGIVCKEILAMKNIEPGNISIDTNHAGMYAATAALIELNGKTALDILGRGNITGLGKDLDKGCMSKTPSECSQVSTSSQCDRRIFG